MNEKDFPLSNMKYHYEEICKITEEMREQARRLEEDADFMLRVVDALLGPEPPSLPLS
jgi:hypothetical protein